MPRSTYILYAFGWEFNRPYIFQIRVLICGAFFTFATANFFLVSFLKMVGDYYEKIPTEVIPICYLYIKWLSTENWAVR